MEGGEEPSGERGGVLQTHTVTADVTYPDCQGHLIIGRDKTQHGQRNGRLSMAAIPQRVELLSSGYKLRTLVAFSQLKEKKKDLTEDLQLSLGSIKRCSFVTGVRFAVAAQ